LQQTSMRGRSVTGENRKAKLIIGHLFWAWKTQGSYKEEEPSTNFFAVALFTLRCIGLVSLVAFLALYS